MGRALEQMAALQYNLDMHTARVRGPVRSVVDLGELAARIGSINTFDRRGDTVWLDDFEVGIGKWVANSWGAGGNVAVSKSYARNGIYSCAMTAGSDGFHMAQIYRVMAYPVLGLLGFECSFAFDSDLDWFGLLFDLYDGTHRHEALVKYDYSNTKLQILDGNGDLHDLETGLDIYVANYPFWTVKVVVDFVNVNYVRVILNNTEYDVSGIDYLYNADASNPRLRPGVKNMGQLGQNAVVYIDDVIITQNEPAND